MIKKVYLIQAHQYPEQLFRLINKLNDSNSCFYIHIDLKSNIDAFKNLIKGENIVFIKERVDCIWGDFSQVKATLNTIKEAFTQNNHDKTTRFILLSGQDYPIKAMSGINNFFDNNIHENFLNIEATDGKNRRYFNNYIAFKVNHSNKRHDFTLVSWFHYKNVIKGVVNRKLAFSKLKLLFVKKKIPLGLTLYRGSNWWSLNGESLKEIIDFYANNIVVLEQFFESTLCPDEIFFQTLIMKLKKNEKNILPTLTYDNWKKKGVVHPVTFTIDDLDELLNQPENKLFARKFDMKLDSVILDELDKIEENA